jgi:hypothetical protein
MTFFAVGCWKILLEEKRFGGMETVNIWSDNGPKHFKISANIRFILSLQQAQPKVDWIYNFFQFIMNIVYVMVLLLISNKQSTNY